MYEFGSSVAAHVHCAGQVQVYHNNITALQVGTCSTVHIRLNAIPIKLDADDEPSQFPAVRKCLNRKGWFPIQLRAPLPITYNTYYRRPRTLIVGAEQTPVWTVDVGDAAVAVLAAGGVISIKGVLKQPLFFFNQSYDLGLHNKQLIYTW